MPYRSLSETEFNLKYQALADYLKTHESTPFPDILKAMNQLPNGHILKDLFVVNGEGKSFLHIAAAEGNLLIITFLKETGHEIGLQDFNKKTPLYDACEKLKLGSVNALLGYAANPNLGDSHLSFKGIRNVEEGEISYNGENIPLVATIKSEATVTASEFAIATKTPEDISRMTDELATERTRARIVKTLLANGADILLQTGIDDSSPFQRAIELKKLLIMNEIADVGGPEIFVQRNRDGEAALNLAVSYWEKDEKEDPEAQAEMEVEEEITDMVIEHAEAKLPSLLAIQELKFGNTPIHTAVICSNYKVLKKLLLKGYKFDSLKNLSRQNYKGNTPIHEAIAEAWRGPKILALLLSVAMPDDLAIVNHAGETAKQMAERLLQEANSVKVLVEKVEKATADLEQFVDGSNEMIEIDEMDVPAELGLLLKAMRDLSNSDPLDDKFSDLNEQGRVLSLEIDNFIIELEKYDIEGFVDQAREQLEKYSREKHWPVEDAKQLIAKATTLNLQGLHIPETPYANQAILSRNDADSLATSARNLIEKYDQNERLLDFSIDQADELGPKARGLLASIKQLEFFQKSYLDSLIEVKQEKYFSWKARQLQLPSSLPKIPTVDTNLFNPPHYIDPTYNAASKSYEEGLERFTSGGNLGEAISLLERSVQLFKPSYARHFALAQAHRALATAYLTQNQHLDVQNHIRLIEDNNERIRQNLEAAIEIFLNLQDYRRLEFAYQSLAKIHISDEFNIANYEEQNRNKISLSPDTQEQLQGHLALAGLYKELREQNFPSTLFSLDNLAIRESYHYHQAYKLTQGKLDNSARVVLQREIGIANNENLGTYNIQQCVAVVAFDPQRKKVVLSHFDRSSGPISFIEQLAKEFSGRTPIHLYISGGRDRGTSAATSIPSLISDNNIDLVLKQIHLKNVEEAADGNPENARFKIKACDVGDKPSPQGIVFDVQSQRLLHATPNLGDSSIESRAVNFMLQKVNEDYVRPLNRVDFTKNKAARTIIFSQHDQSKIHALLRDSMTYYANNPQTKAWEHDQVFYPLKVVSNEIATGTPPDFTRGLLTKYRTQFINSRSGTDIHRPAESLDTQDVEERFQALQMIDPNNFLDDATLSQTLHCLGNRRKRSAGLCTLDSERLLEGLAELSESKQAEVLEHISTRNVGGAKQEAIATLVQKYKLSQHLQRVGDISSKAMDGFFAADAAIGFLKGDKSKAAIFVNLKALDLVSKGGGRVAGVALNTFNTYEDFNNLLQHSNDTGAWLRFASSGMQTTVDVGSFGLRAAEAASEAFAALEISASFEVVGGGVVAILILADRFYEAGKAVGDEEKLLRKDFSFGTKVTEFIEAIFGDSEFKEKINDISEYENLLPQLQEFLKKHPELKYFVSPAIKLIETKKKCLSHGLTGKGCRRYQYTPIFAEIKNNSVNFSAKQTGFKLNDEVQDALPNGQFACLPTGNDISLEKDGAYRCEGAFALSNANGSIAYFNLMQGDDRAIGFKNLSNIYIIDDGKKAYLGGDRNDQFILVGKRIVTSTQQNSEIGGLDGGAGLDTLDMRAFKPEADHIELNLLAGTLKYNNSELRVTSMEYVLGGTIPLGVTVACDTEVLDTATTEIPKSPDFIFIPNNSSCDYNLEIHLHSQMRVMNSAEKGHFIYSVSPRKGNVFVNLVTHPINPLSSRVSGIHQFEFDATLAEVNTITFPAQLPGFQRLLELQFNKSLPGQAEQNFNFTLFTPQFNTVSLRFSDQGKLKIGDKNLYYVHLDLQQPASEIIDYYAPLMKQHNLIGFFITGTNEHILIGHNKHEVMQNNPNAFRTHLCGNGGEGIFKIKSGIPRLDLSHLPILQVDIYDVGGRDINILDFSAIAQQVETQMNRTAQLFLVTPNPQNNLGDDLLLVLGLPSSRVHQITPIATVGIPKAFHPSQHHWFKKRLHIILGNKNKRLKIEGRHKQLFLIPVPPDPVVLDKKLEVVKLSVSHLEANSTLIIPQAYAAGSFFQDNKTNLIWTNTLTGLNSSHHCDPFTFIIDKFLQEPKDLFLRFTDKTTLTLSHEINHSIADFTEAKLARLASLRDATLAIINPKPLTSITQSTLASSMSVMQNLDLNNIKMESIESNYLDSDEVKNTNKFLERRRRATENVDFIATSGAVALQNWIQIPRLFTTHILQVTGEFFTQLQTTIENFGAYLLTQSIAERSDSLQQTSLLGNKTAIAHTNPIQEMTPNQDLPLQSCVSVSLVNTDQESSQGVSCEIPNGKISFFHSTSYGASPPTSEKREVNFENCKPIEWKGRSAVVCEGKEKTAIITPQLPQRFFDGVDNWLMLGQVALVMGKNIFTKFFPKPVTDTRYQLIHKLSEEQVALWNNKLAEISIQLQGMQGLGDEKQRNWIQYRLEDRQEELKQFLQSDRITDYEKSKFQENLLALQEMLDEIAENSMEIPPEPQQDPDVFPRAANTGNYARNTNTPLGFFNTASNQAISSVSPSNELTHDRQNLLR